MLVVPTFQKGDLAKQQPVYQGRVGDGGQGDGAEAGAKEGLGLRVGRGLAIDCDGQGCEEEKRDLGRLGLAGCPFFLVAKGPFLGFWDPFLPASQTHSVASEGRASKLSKLVAKKKHKFTFLVLAFFSLL